MQGKFITFYGVNNIGKSTHAKRTVDHLNKIGKKAQYVKFPIYNCKESGEFLNSVLRGGGQKISERELQLWFIINRHQFEPTLRKMLKEGTWVVAEDYTGTGIAWGMTKGLDQKWLESANEGLLKEDLSILIDGERAKDAQEEGHIHEQNDELMKKCREIHLQLGEDYGWEKVQLQPEKDDTEKLIWDVVSKSLL
jgi:thymidylate kinase